MRVIIIFMCIVHISPYLFLPIWMESIATVVHEVDDDDDDDGVVADVVVTQPFRHFIATF